MPVSLAQAGPGFQCAFNLSCVGVARAFGPLGMRLRLRADTGGGEGIRTRGQLAASAVFEAAPKGSA
jgi:hypothetical protein